MPAEAHKLLSSNGDKHEGWLREVGHTRATDGAQSEEGYRLLGGGKIGWVDPVHEFHHTLMQLKKDIARTERDLQAALANCHSRETQQGLSDHQACNGDRAVAEVHGRMQRLKVAMHHVASLKPVAFELHREGTRALDSYKNTTELVMAAKVRLGATEMQRNAVQLKLENMRKVETAWRDQMHQVAKNVLEQKKRLGEAETRLSGAEEKRFGFLSKLHAIVEGVAVGDQAAEMTYEEAEATLKRARDRESAAKAQIFKAERMLDAVDGKVKEGEWNKKKAQSQGAPNIISNTGGVDNFGRGSTAGLPLPLNGG